MALSIEVEPQERTQQTVSNTAIQHLQSHSGTYCPSLGFGPEGYFALLAIDQSAGPSDWTWDPTAGMVALLLSPQIQARETTPATTVVKPVERTTPEWLNDIYRSVGNNPREGLLTLYREVNHMLNAGQFNEALTIVRGIDLQRLDTTLTIGVLTCLFPAREKFVDWSSLYRKVQERLQEIAPLRVTSLLNGLD